MAVTFTDIIAGNGNTFLIRWTSDATAPVSFRVYREGRKVTAFTSADGTGEVVLVIAPDTSPYLEVLDNDSLQPSPAFSGHLTLNWMATAGAESYAVQWWDGSAWQTQASIEDTGFASYSWLTQWLADSTTHQFRIVTTATDGTTATSATMNLLMVRHPDSPNVTYTYSAGTGKVTIAAA